MYINFFDVDGYPLTFFCADIISTSQECHGTMFCRNEKIPRVPQLINDVPNSAFTARFSTNSTQAGTSRSPIRTKRGTIPSSDSTSKFVVRNLGDKIVFIDFPHAGGRKSLFPKFGPVPVLTKLATVSMDFDEIPTDIRTRYVALQKNDVVCFGPSSHCILILYSPFCGIFRSCSFAETSILSVLSSFACVVVMLSARMGGSVDESLCSTSDATLSCGRCVVTKVTVRWSFAYSFSPGGCVLDPLAKVRFADGLFCRVGVHTSAIVADNTVFGVELPPQGGNRPWYPFCGIH